MDFAEARAAFFQPRDPAATRELPWRSPARRLRDAIEPIAATSFWVEPAHREYAALGLDFLQGYVWSRASVLGEPDGAVVAAAFGVFDPDTVMQAYDAGRAACGLAEIRAARETGAVEGLRAVLGTPDALADVVAALHRATAAADTTGRALSAGVAALAEPDDDLGRLWHACTLLREHRGDSHLAACVAAGLTGLEANILTELWVGWQPLEYTATRAWSAEAMQRATDRLTARGLVAGGALTDAGTALRERVEETTDAAAAPVVDAIGDELPAVLDRVEDWSRRIVDAGWFPPDPYKSASG